MKDILKPVFVFPALMLAVLALAAWNNSNRAENQLATANQDCDSMGGELKYRKEKYKMYYCQGNGGVLKIYDAF